jgi:hypothetical protein
MGMVFGAYIYIGLLAWYIDREIDQVEPSHQSKPNQVEQDIVTKATITITSQQPRRSPEYKNAQPRRRPGRLRRNLQPDLLLLFFFFFFFFVSRIVLLRNSAI